MPIFTKGRHCVNFIHIPKCAGTSIERTLYQNCDKYYLQTGNIGSLPCTPQHFHADILSELIKDVDSTPSFAIVRHPLLRIISEYFWANRKLETPPDPNKYILGLLTRYRRNHFVNDNHIRHQTAFVLRKTQIFKLENGIDLPLKYALKELKLSNKITINNFNRSKSKNITLSANTIKKVEAFYDIDYKIFSYTKLKLNKACYNYHEIKKMILSDDNNKQDVKWLDLALIEQYHNQQRALCASRARTLRNEAKKIENISREAAFVLRKEANRLMPIENKAYQINQQQSEQQQLNTRTENLLLLLARMKNDLAYSVSKAIAHFNLTSKR